VFKFFNLRNLRINTLQGAKLMTDRMIVTPFFLDEFDPTIAEMAGDDWRVVLPALPDGDQLSRMSAIHNALAEQVREAVAAGERPVSIAGDCCATLGVLAGLQRAGLAPTLIWLDAHGDFNTMETTPSGFLGGMPLAMAAGLGDQTLVEGVGLRPWPADKIILSDGRDLDPGERENVSVSGIRHEPDIAALIRPDALPAGPLYVHFDADVIDPADAPAMTYAAPGGPSSETVRDVLRSLNASHRLAAVSVTLWTPELDHDGQTQAVVQGAMNALLGR
jgi:arginase